jgi:hypothetical protein
MFWLFSLSIIAVLCLLQSDYLVTDASSKASKSIKNKSSRLLGIPVVSMDFVLDAAESGPLLAVEQYTVLQPPQGI